MLRHLPLVFNFSLSTFLYLSYIYYYLKINKKLGLGAAYLYLFLLLNSHNFYHKKNSFVYALTVHILSWIIQILSHKYIEGNQPAFKDGIKQSFLVAPLFVVYEIKEFICYFL